MKKLKVTLTIGISNSGKSTWAEEFVKNNSDTVELNRDNTRITNFCGGDRSRYGEYEFDSLSEDIVTDIIMNKAYKALRDNKNLIISDTNLHSITRQSWKDFADANNLEYEERHFDVDIDTCLERNEKRDISIPPWVIRKQFDRYKREFSCRNQ